VLLFCSNFFRGDLSLFFYSIQPQPLNSIIDSYDLWRVPCLDSCFKIVPLINEELNGKTNDYRKQLFSHGCRTSL
jgi:hypothetical protein